MHDDLRERLAALEHDQWSGWMRWMFARMRQDDAGRWIMGTADAARWQRQMRTPYDALAEDEKQSDRAEADRVLALFATVCAQSPAALAQQRCLLAEQEHAEEDGAG